MTQTLTPTTSPHAQAPPNPEGSAAIDDLHRATTRFGQMDVGDPRWAQEEAQLDRLLGQAVLLSDYPRAWVWAMIAMDPATPLVVKLRTFGAAVASLRGA